MISPRTGSRAAPRWREAREPDSRASERHLVAAPRRCEPHPNREQLRWPVQSSTLAEVEQKGGPGPAETERRIADDELGVGGLVGPTKTAGELVPNASRIRTESHGGGGPAGHGDPPPAEPPSAVENSRTPAPRDPRCRMAGGSPFEWRQSARASGPASTRPRPGLAEGAWRQGRRDRPGEGEEERLDVQVRDPADPQHQLHTLITL
jgi:hypothetical protein